LRQKYLDIMRNFIILFSFLISCNSEHTADNSIDTVKTNNSTPRPQKAAGIPENAFWVGGSDGGQWYVVDSVNKVAKTAVFKIYDDYSGRLVVNKRFQLNCSGSPAELNWDKLDTEILTWDGRRIILQLINDQKQYCSFE